MSVIFYQLRRALPEILMHLAKRIFVKRVRLKKKNLEDYRCEIFEGYEIKPRKGVPGISMNLHLGHI